jgi:hypothetical protein
VGFNYDQFYIYRGTDPDKFEVIDSIEHDPLQVRMQYTDLTAEEGTRYFYIVKVNTPDTVFVENPGDRKAGNGPFVHSLSNLEDNLLLGKDMNELDIVNQNLDVFPNPINDNATIQYKIENPLDIEMTIFSITGNEIAGIFKGKQTAGEHEISFNPTDFGLKPGIFILRMRVGDYGILTRRLVKQ